MGDAEPDALTAARADVPPCPGAWRRAPYGEREVGGARCRVLAVDAGIGAIGMRADGGSVRLLPETGEEPGC
ncbi:hypothetical protein [Kitasatospora sp. NPDC090308]|uniref:hypothetical protein n=1 Tax=Kitasatospora sp. NPDC090308 TaxID=3364082 RepID=UPI00381507B7